MVLFFIAELALTVAFKLSTWCLGKTFDGIMYVVKRRSNKRADDNDNDNDNDNDTDFVVISRQEYRSLKKSHVLHQLSASESASESASVPSGA
jgi:hypothetical protein